jgi:hypothetical protein
MTEDANISQNNPDNLPVVSKVSVGRPTGRNSVEIAEALRPYYNRGFSSHKVSELLAKREKKPIKISDRTIRVYFKRWTDKAVRDYNTNFIIRDKEVKTRTLMSIEENLQYLYDIKDRLSTILEAEWQNYREEINNKNYSAVPPPLRIDSRLEISRAITNALMFKYQIESAPTIDDRLTDQVRIFIENTKQRFLKTSG